MGVNRRTALLYWSATYTLPKASTNTLEGYDKVAFTARPPSPEKP